MIERIETVSNNDIEMFTEKLGCLIEQMQHDNLTVEVQYNFGFAGRGQMTPVQAYTALVIGRRNNG